MHCMAVGVVVGGAFAFGPVVAEEAGMKAPVQNQGMTVEVDPSTGKIIPPRTLPPLSPAEQNSLSTSSEGLQEAPGTSPAGGYKLDLKGRFQSPLMATVGPDGKAVVQHLESDAHSHGQEHRK